MALELTRLTEIVYIAGSAGAIYSNPASTKSLVRGLLLHNTNTTAETVAIHWVPDAAGASGTASVANRFANFSLAANETMLFEFPFSLVLTDQNEGIFAAATTASKVTVAVIGDKDA